VLNGGLETRKAAPSYPWTCAVHVAEETGTRPPWPFPTVCLAMRYAKEITAGLNGGVPGVNK